MTADRPLWLGPTWLQDELLRARRQLEIARKQAGRLHDTTTDYARSITTLIEARAAVVEVLERKLREVDRG